MTGGRHPARALQEKDMYWDPYNRNRWARERRLRAEQERQRRLAEEEAERRAQVEAEMRRRAQAEEARRQSRSVTEDLLARFERELAEARRERDEWADRYDRLMATLEAQREALEQERAALETERAKLQEEARNQAEAQRERIQRNAEQRAFEENREVLLRMLEVADNLDRALAQVEQNETSPIAEGLRLTHREFTRALERSGVSRMESRGSDFDPAFHEAVATVPSEEHSGTILEEVSPGYLYRDTLLRPAQVVVAA